MSEVTRPLATRPEPSSDAVVRILVLSQLEPGDVILETGSPVVAAATGGQFGHASIALGRLVKMEAGLDEGVEVNPFEFRAFRGDRRVVGVPIGADECVAVFRLNATMDTGRMLGEALWEGGRRYSTRKLLDLPDLAPRARIRLEHMLARESIADIDQEGRFCSEVVARILRLTPTDLSPNALAAHPELLPVPDAVQELEETWTEERTTTSSQAVRVEVGELRLGLAELAMSRSKSIAARVKRHEMPLWDGAKQLEQELTAEVIDALAMLHSIAALEASLLADQSDPIG